jgi:hypothetical protein
MRIKNKKGEDGGLITLKTSSAEQILLPEIQEVTCAQAGGFFFVEYKK